MSKKNKKEAAGAAPVEESKKRGKKTKAPKAAGRVQDVFGHPIRNLIVAAVVGILAGVAFFLKPYEVSQYCGYGVGGVIAVVGIVYIILYFCHKPVSGEYRSEFAMGLLALLAGAYVALSGILFGGSGVGYVLAVRILGILVFADALLKLQYSVDIARMKFRPWWVVLILAVLGLGIGVLATTDFTNTAIGSRSTPASYLYTMGENMGIVTNMGSYNGFYSGMKMLGIAFWANAVLDIASLIVIAIRNHQARRDEAIAEGTAMVQAAQREQIDELLPPEEVIPSEPDTVFVPAPEPEAPAPAVPDVPAPAHVASAEPAAPIAPVVDPPQAEPME